MPERASESQGRSISRPHFAGGTVAISSVLLLSLRGIFAAAPVPAQAPVTSPPKAVALQQALTSKEIAALIAQIGHEDFPTRERAHALLARPRFPTFIQLYRALKTQERMDPQNRERDAERIARLRMLCDGGYKEHLEPHVSFGWSEPLPPLSVPNDFELPAILAKGQKLKGEAVRQFYLDQIPASVPTNGTEQVQCWLGDIVRQREATRLLCTNLLDHALERSLDEKNVLLAYQRSVAGVQQLHDGMVGRNELRRGLRTLIFPPLHLLPD